MHPNPWNYNTQDERERRAARESIATYGFIDPVTVRPHPDLPGQYQIIDGEHRWMGAIDLGLEAIPLTVLDPCPDVVAKKLTVVLNEIKGSPDRQLLGALLADLQNEGDDLTNALPFTTVDVEGLLAEVGAGMNEPPEPKEPNDQRGDPDDEWFSIHARLPMDVGEVWTEAVDRVRSRIDGRLHDDPKIQAGQVIELLCASFLAEPVQVTG